MQTDYIWHNGEFVRWEDAKVHVLTHSLHYGGAAFEGIRAYKTVQGTAIFRLKEHLQRLVYSTSVINMTLPYSEDELSAVIIELVQRNKLDHCYIRPIAYYGYGKMGVSPVGAPVEVSIACWPWGAYLPHDMVDIQTSKFIRIPPNATVADAKLTGNYLNGIFAILKLQGTHYHEALLLDINSYIAEGPGENFFIVKDNVIYTPKLGTILAGITRETVIELAKLHNFKVIEKDLRLEDAYKADEAFFTGTAAEVTPIKTIDDKVIGKGTIGPVTEKLRKDYLDIVNGKNKAFLKYLTFI
jgi:branched-chain amino acid aminotransferase